MRALISERVHLCIDVGMMFSLLFWQRTRQSVIGLVEVCLRSDEIRTEQEEHGDDL